MPRTPINYQNTIIYKIVCNDLNIKDLYVGHTTDFRRRKNGHKSRSSSSEIKIYKTIRNNGGWDNWSMIEIEKFPCNDSNEASARERYWYEALQAKLNMVYPQRTKKEHYEANTEKIKEYREINKEKIRKKKKEYYETNKEKIDEKNKEYREKNKEKIDEKAKEYYDNNKDKIKAKKNVLIECECGSHYTLGHRSHHFKTLKHKKFIEQQNK